MCVNGNVYYDFTYLYRVYSYMYTSCTCIRAWLLHALSKQSCKAIVRERAYSDSICTIDVTPWGFASLACVFREIGSSTVTQIDQRLSLRTRSTSTLKQSPKSVRQIKKSPPGTRRHFSRDRVERQRRSDTVDLCSLLRTFNYIP